MSAGGYIRILKLAIGGLCLSMAILGWIVQLHPLGPHGATFRIIHLVASSSALVAAGWWVFGRWPSYEGAVAFVVWADATVALAASMLSAPASRICATIHLGLIGVFAAFLLGRRILVLHCVFAITVITALTAVSVVVDHVSWFDLYIYFAPAVSTVVVMPVVIQTVIDGGRRLARKVTRAALRDPMTGLFNRRGMYGAVREMIRQDRTTVLAVAVIDLDGFKTLNDIHGHEHGDAAIRTVASVLKTNLRGSDVIARTGGDEFVVIAEMDSVDELPTISQRVSGAAHLAESTVTASIGIASYVARPGRYTDEDLDTAIRHADRAMYEAKRSGGNRVCVFERT